MALLLHIDTATSYGAVALSENNNILTAFENHDQKGHASFLHTAIEKLLQQHSADMKQIDAVCVTIGPGSYTGLRVGLSAGKGLCFALKKPLIAVSTLQAMALASGKNEVRKQCDRPVLFAPMIDARRNEVFTALYNEDYECYSPAQAMILSEETYSDVRKTNCVIFSGDGSEKLKKIDGFSSALFSNSLHTIAEVVALGYKNFEKEIFEDVAYCEPMYIKPFYTENNKVK